MDACIIDIQFTCYRLLCLYQPTTRYIGSRKLPKTRQMVTTPASSRVCNVECIYRLSLEHALYMHMLSCRHIPSQWEGSVSTSVLYVTALHRIMCRTTCAHYMCHPWVYARSCAIDHYQTSWGTQIIMFSDSYASEFGAHSRLKTVIFVYANVNADDLLQYNMN